MYECLICDRRFHEFDVQTDEFGNRRAVCPYCKGDIEDMYECKICGELMSEDDLWGGVCLECIDKHTNLDNCIEFGNDDKRKVEVNGFIFSLLTEEQINDILVRIIRDANTITPIDCSEYVSDDYDWYGEQVVKQKEQRKCQ